MKLTFLGTSAGCPTKTRNVSAVAVSFDQRSDWVLIDCGEATQHQLLRVPLSLARLSRIFITHLHGDHCYGLPGLLGTRTMQGIGSPLEITGPKGLKAYLSSVLKVTGQHVSYPLRLIELDGPGTFLESELESVAAVPVAHDIPCFAFVFREADKTGAFRVDQARALGVPEGPLFGRLKRGEIVTLENGRRIDGSTLVGPPTRGRRILICGDNDQPAILHDHLADIDLLVHEATFTEKTKAAIQHSVRHATADRVARAAQAAGVPNLILTHFSPRYPNHSPSAELESLDDLKAEATARFSGRLFLARDFDQFILHPDRSVTRIRGASRSS